MESHVNNQPTLGALRCEIMAALIGNPLFTREEQLLTNHRVHECEDRQMLSRWLVEAQQEVEGREQAATSAARQAAQMRYCETGEQARELQRLTTCRALNAAERRFAKMAAPTCQTTAEYLTVVGRIYVETLHRFGKLDESYGYAE